MDARGMLKAGVALAILALLLNVALGFVQGQGSQGLQTMLRVPQRLADTFGLLLLVMAVHGLLAPGGRSGLFSAGIGLFLLGRLGSLSLSLVLANNQFNDPTVGLLFTFLGVVVSLGILFLFVGLFRAAVARLGEPRGAPQPGPAPPRAEHATSVPGARAAPPPPPRRASFRPPQAPLARPTSQTAKPPEK